MGHVKACAGALDRGRSTERHGCSRLANFDLQQHGQRVYTRHDTGQVGSLEQCEHVHMMDSNHIRTALAKKVKNRIESRIPLLRVAPRGANLDIAKGLLIKLQVRSSELWRS